MKKITIIIMVIVMLVAVTMLSAITWGDAGGQMLNVLKPIIVLCLIPLVTRLFKKIGVDIANDATESYLTAIINILVNIDLKNPTMLSSDKKRLAVQEVRNMLQPSAYNALERKYGSIEASVQAAFEKSSLNKQLKMGQVPLSPTTPTKQ